jgi:outer membrane protein assembly factor BamB
MVVLVTLLSHAQRVVDPSDAIQRIVALDPRWTVTFETAPSAPAGYDDQTAYVPLKSGDLVAVALDGGEVRWKVALPTSQTPATGDGFVFTASDRFVMALDQSTGQTVWRTPMAQSIAGPLYWEAGWLIASTDSGEVVAFNGDDGQIMWRVALGSPLAVAPSSSGERLYVALTDGRVAALTLTSGDAEWTAALNETPTGLLALQEQLVIGTRANLLHSLNLTNGRIRWSQKAGADIAGAPVADEDRIYFVAMDNVVRGLNRRSGSIVWTRPLPSRPALGPLRIGDQILVPLTTNDIHGMIATTGSPSFTIKAVGELGGIVSAFLRDHARATAPRVIAISREGTLQGFASRFDPVPAPLPELPGVKITG